MDTRVMDTTPVNHQESPNSASQPIVIIGAGMAGYSLARELRKLNPEVAITLISADHAANYSKPMLSNALAGNKQPHQIAMADVEKMRSQLNLTILNHTRVESIDAIQHSVTLQAAGQTQQLLYRQLVLALGARPVRLPIEGDGAADILAVNHLDDYAAFRQQLDALSEQKNTKRVLIIGAGLIGCEFANDLQHGNHQVTVVDLADQPLGRLLPKPIASRFQRALTELGIDFKLAVTVTAVDKGLTGYQVQLSNGETVEADIVLSAVGLAAERDLAERSNIATARGIITDTYLATNQQDIFAIGDCAEVDGHVLPYVMPLMQQVRALAKTLTGTPTAVHYPAMPVAVKTPAAPLTILPVPQGVDVEWQLEELADGMIAQAFDQAQILRGFVLLGATAAKQRLTLAKAVPDLIAIQAD